jgi:hypothetical protein
MEYTDTAMNNAVAITKKIESFLADCDAYIQGYTVLGEINEPYLLKVVEKKVAVNIHSSNGVKSFHYPTMDITKCSFLKVFLLSQSCCFLHLILSTHSFLFLV